MRKKQKHVWRIVWIMLGIAGGSAAERVDSNGCYASWTNDRLVVGNSRFERAWVADDKGLVPVSFVIKDSGVEWLSAGKKVQSPGSIDVKSSTGRRSVVGSEGVRLDITAGGTNSRKVSFWIFPNTAGVLEEPMDDRSDRIVEREATATGIEVELQARQPAASGSREGTLILRPQHLRITQVDLMDQTDHHNELVVEREWLLLPSEAKFEVRGCVLVAENVLDGTGLMSVKLSPLPHARQDKDAVDFQVNPAARSITAVSNGYPQATIGYSGGRAGRVQALHAFQRSLREYKAGRDGLFLSNTWGDRSRDARINENFLLGEIAAGAALGVDVVQIDDGWQKGRTANSAAARGKGVWDGYWAADPAFWDADPTRFPNGLEPVIRAAREKGMGFGLWFGPDSSHDAANWQKDADCLLKFHREMGVDYFKIDSMKTLSATAMRNQRALFDRMLEGSDGKMTFDLDVTAEIRPGYFGLPDAGPIFVENRYTDFRNYWPHQTLRNLWKLAQVVDPLRLRMELLNHTRNPGKYPDDPLAPALYQADTLFAITMMANPLGWFEVSNLPPAYVASVKPLVEIWKQERARMHGGNIVPVGSVPDGAAWTGFVSAAADGKGGYALLFRELNSKPSYSLELSMDPGPSSQPFVLVPGATRATVIGGRGSARLSGNTLTVEVPEKLDFVWVRLE